MTMFESGSAKPELLTFKNAKKSLASDPSAAAVAGSMVWMLGAA